MKLLFIHPNMPGQYKHILQHYAAQGTHEIIFLTKPKPQVQIRGVRKIEYQLPKKAHENTHPYLRNTETAVLESQYIFRICRELQKKEAFVPNIIIAHVGWGGCLFLKDAYPNVPILGYMEFFYHAEGYNHGFLPDDIVTDETRARIRMQNLIHLSNLEMVNQAISPTNFQKSAHPTAYHHKITVLHEGVDTDVVRPQTRAHITLPSGVTLNTQKTPIITYISRNYEPYRGFPQTMRAMAEIQKRHPECHIICVGQDGVSYGQKPKNAKNWREEMLQEVELDQERIHFIGYLAHEQMTKVLQVSTAHIYLTVPFVLSWSLLEAMSCACCIIASDTKPVQEVIKHQQNGYLVDFFDPIAIADQIDAILTNPEQRDAIRHNARQTILDHYALKKLLPEHLNLIEQMTASVG